jgi:hypothetical protein
MAPPSYKTILSDPEFRKRIQGPVLFVHPLAMVRCWLLFVADCLLLGLFISFMNCAGL